jgi:hypothetical protein
MRTALRAVAAALLIAAAIDLAFPRATSNASVGRPAAPAAVDVRSVARLSAITQIAQVNRPRICPIDWRQSTWHVKRLIRCAAEHHNLSQRRALYIAWRESRYQAQAFNRAGPAAGIYQHLLRYWPDRARKYGFPDWSPFNARANIIVTMRMVKDHGWAPWAL